MLRDNLVFLSGRIWRDKRYVPIINRLLQSLLERGCAFQAAGRAAFIVNQAANNLALSFRAIHPLLHEGLLSGETYVRG